MDKNGYIRSKLRLWFYILTSRVFVYRKRTACVAHGAESNMRNPAELGSYIQRIGAYGQNPSKLANEADAMVGFLKVYLDKLYYRCPAAVTLKVETS